MSQQITSGALALLQRALGLAGRAQSTELQDGDASLVLDIAQMSSAAQPGLVDGGQFILQSSITHVGAGAALDSIDVYAPTTVANIPSDLGLEYDVWLLGAALTVISSAAFTAGALLLDQSTRSPVVGGVSTISVGLAAFDDALSNATGGLEDVCFGPSGAFQKIGIRVPRSAAGLQHVSRVSAATTTRMWVYCEYVRPGLRPSGF